MTIDPGRSASPSGHSRAEPEEVSALRASVPNAISRNELRRLHFSLGGSPETLAAILAEDAR